MVLAYLTLAFDLADNYVSTRIVDMWPHVGGGETPWEIAALGIVNRLKYLSLFLFSAVACAAYLRCVHASLLRLQAPPL